MEALRWQGRVAHRRLPAPGGCTVASPQVLPATKDPHIRELEHRVRDLERQPADCHGTLYDRLRGAVWERSWEAESLREGVP